MTTDLGRAELSSPWDLSEPQPPICAMGWPFFPPVAAGLCGRVWGADSPRAGAESPPRAPFFFLEGQADAQTQRQRVRGQGREEDPESETAR